VHQVTSTWSPPSATTPLRGGSTLRWGVVGPGGIADYLVSTVRAHTDQQIVAVASRSLDRAADARRHGIDRAYDSYEQLLADPGVDIVYVATRHSSHCALGLATIAAGKNVLIDEPLGGQRRRSGRDRRRRTLGRGDGGRAMWTRYLPQFDVLNRSSDVAIWARSSSPPPTWAGRWELTLADDSTPIRAAAHL
jgi:hypothetical protein